MHVWVEQEAKERKTGTRHLVQQARVTMNRARTEYFCNISVGSPRQDFTVLIDTGSSTLAVFSRMPPQHGNLRVPSDKHGRGPDTDHSSGQRGSRRRGRAHESRNSIFLQTKFESQGFAWQEKDHRVSKMLPLAILASVIVGLALSGWRRRVQKRASDCFACERDAVA